MNNFFKNNINERRRIHYIPEWAALKNLKQSQIADALDVDKGIVSKWFTGNTPKPFYLQELAALFDLQDIGLLFLQPQQWLVIKAEMEPELHTKASEIALLFTRLNPTEREHILSTARLLTQRNPANT